MKKIKLLIAFTAVAVAIFQITQMLNLGII
ncbi:MAG: hypothetical protein ACJA0U_000630 [Salibacteraceae bacterium]|jgi:hypothetical protein